jgi:hypothetical protein
MSLARASRQYLGVRALLPPDLQTAERNPTTTDKAYVKGTLWLNTASPASYMYSGASGVWIALGTSSSGDITSLTGSSGGAITPVAGNITLAAGTGMLSIVGTAGTLTFNVNFAAPPALGSGTPAAVTGTTVGSTGAMTAGTGLTATTGNISASAGSVSAATTVTAGTSITATLGNITATNGNFVKGSAANKDVYTSLATTTTAGANAAGTVTLVGGTATISTTAITAASKIRHYRQSIGATGAAATGNISIGTISAGVSFVINSVSAADATALAATDVSVVFWEIVN